MLMSYLVAPPKAKPSKECFTVSIHVSASALSRPCSTFGSNGVTFKFLQTNYNYVMCNPRALSKVFNTCLLFVGSLAAMVGISGIHTVVCRML